MPLIPMLAVMLLAPPALSAEEPCGPASADSGHPLVEKCTALEEITIFGSAREVHDIAGGGNHLTAEDLAQFVTTDVVRAIRRVPGVSLQVEDGYGLRPNISIRGTATERSSRVTLMEDNVLIAPATYTAPSAYYFPTFGRIHAMEVLKGPAAITQGPYTVGGAINLVSTPIPQETSGHLLTEAGSESSWRVHGWYGGVGDRAAFLVETHQWSSDGYQRIDRSASDTGLDKQDYLAKLRWTSDPSASLQQALEIKVQASEEQSRQSYLGLTDGDFAADSLRRYGASARDEMDNDHQQVTATWRLQLANGSEFALTAYNNEFERAWYKTEGMDFDGSDTAQAFQRTSWASIISAINADTALAGRAADQLQAWLDGADTPAGAIQLRNNSRAYYARGVQLTARHRLDLGTSSHELQAGLRYHRDQEDRLQRNDSFQQLDGELLLSDRGLQGNAGNRVQDADAWAFYVHDRIEWNRWTFAPGLRLESIELARVDYHTSGDDPSSREPGNIKSGRENRVDVWIPGMGVLYDFNDGLRLVAGVHKGFSTPGNQPGVDPEESVNYELGLRYRNRVLQLDVMGFFNDYDNLVGVCTNSSGSNCEAGDAFNGDGVRVPGLEITLLAEPSLGNEWYFPLQLAYTWMQAEFQTDFDSEFFGLVMRGDPVPYIPEHQAWVSAGVVRNAFSAYVSANRVSSLCTKASCGLYQRTDAATVVDLSAQYQLNEQWQLYAVVENLLDERYIAGREPYGARPNKPRGFNLGARFDF